MFQPTHYLVSKTRQIPVQLIATPQGATLITEEEWKTGSPPAFSIHPKRGFFCHDIQVLGFSLEPIVPPTQEADQAPANKTQADKDIATSQASDLQTLNR